MNEFFFEARLDRTADYVGQLLVCLGEAFQSSLTEAAIHEALTNAILYGALGAAPAAAEGERDIEALLAFVSTAQAADHARGRIQVVVERVKQSPDAIVCVSDPGPGFDWAHWRRTLRPVGSPTTSWSNVPVAGRGLIIMHGASKALGWNEKGNAVWMRFAPRPAARAGATPLDRAEARRGRVLVVDDDIATRVTLRRTVQSIGCDVCECDDGPSALEVVQYWQPHLVLINARMGEAGGLALVEQLATVRPPNVIAFAHQLDDGLAVAALSSGAIDCLRLPIWPVELVARLRRAMTPRAAHT